MKWKNTKVNFTLLLMSWDSLLNKVFFTYCRRSALNAGEIMIMVIFQNWIIYLLNLLEQFHISRFTFKMVETYRKLQCQYMN